MQGEESGNEKILKFMQVEVKDHKSMFGKTKRVAVVGGHMMPVKDIPYIRSFDWLSVVILTVRAMNKINGNFYDLRLMDRFIVDLDTEGAYIEVVQFINALNNLKGQHN